MEGTDRDVGYKIKGNEGICSVVPTVTMKTHA